MRFSPLGGQLGCFVKDQRKSKRRISENCCQTKTTYVVAGRRSFPSEGVPEEVTRRRHNNR